MRSILKKHSSLYKVWTNDEKEKWNKVQKKGVANFILIHGILKWGLISSIIFIISFNTVSTSKLDILFTAGIWFLASILYGYCIWLGTNASFYENHQKNERN